MYGKVLNIAGASICKQHKRSEYAKILMSWLSSEYTSGSKYASILNMSGFWICLIDEIAGGYSTS